MLVATLVQSQPQHTHSALLAHRHSTQLRSTLQLNHRLNLIQFLCYSIPMSINFFFCLYLSTSLPTFQTLTFYVYMYTYLLVYSIFLFSPNFSPSLLHSAYFTLLSHLFLWNNLLHSFIHTSRPTTTPFLPFLPFGLLHHMFYSTLPLFSISCIYTHAQMQIPAITIFLSLCFLSYSSVPIHFSLSFSLAFSPFDKSPVVPI